jgi:hypothetical protein
VTAPFALAANSCGTVSLAAASDCQIQIDFAPTQAGPATGTFTLTDGAGAQTVELTGVGLSGPTDTLSPASLTFPATAAGQSSPAQTVTLANSGGEALESISVTVTSGFSFTNGCTTQLGANTSCAIAVEFDPTQTGSTSGMLTVTDALRSQTVALSGVGVAPAAISVSPASLTFANQQPGVASAPQTVTVTNDGGAAMANVGFALTGPAAANYSVAATTCGATLNAQGSCTVQVVFTPAATGPIAATLVVSSSTPGVSAVQVPLNGSGQLTAGLAATPAQLAFANAVGVGQSSAAQTVTISNGTGFSLVSVSIAASGPFALSANTCTGALVAGASCSVAVAFAPTATGAATGVLAVSSASVATATTVPLAGTGFDFALGTSGAGSLTVASGQTANFPLTVTPSGAQATFSFACGALPPNAACTFNPGTETLNAGVEGNVTAEIATGQSSTSAAINDSKGQESKGRRRAPDGRPMLPLLCGLVLLPLVLVRGRRVFLAVLLLAILAAGISSCTSSSGGTGGTPGGGDKTSTPPGTYTIPVTVTADGLSHAVSLTLTVD